MKDFIHDDVLAELNRFSQNARSTSAPITSFLPLTANNNSPYSQFVPARGPLKVQTNPWYRERVKPVFDALLIILSLPITLPVILFCAIALWMEGGQPFYRQDRLGRNGKIFSIWKLRTMVRDADQQLETCLAADPALRREWNSTQKLKNDPRITRIGGLLRKTSLDELPQLLNVLKGEMSLVGPRPMMPDQLELYGDTRPYFALLPGITGVWQVSARNEQNFSYRADIDADYFESVSLWRDLSLLLKTVGVVFRRTGY